MERNGTTFTFYPFMGPVVISTRTQNSSSATPFNFFAVNFQEPSYPSKYAKVYCSWNLKTKMYSSVAACTNQTSLFHHFKNTNCGTFFCVGVLCLVYLTTRCVRRGFSLSLSPSLCWLLLHLIQTHFGLPVLRKMGRIVVQQCGTYEPRSILQWQKIPWSRILRFW
jgi:hypothetical protein